MRAGNFKNATIILALAVTAALAWPRLFLDSTHAAADTEYQMIKVFTEVLAEIENKYVEKKAPEELITEALKGMVSSLDPHSAYLTPDEFGDLQIETKGSFHGVGIEITLKDGVFTVVSPIEGTPAYLAGVQTGDRIIKIDGKLTKGMGLHDAVKSIRGLKGTQVTLTLMRESAQKMTEVAITRDVIPLHSVRYNLLEDGFGYVRISSFQENTTTDLIKALQTLQGQKTPLRGLVLDLRNDPGGLLQEAVSVADQFLKEGVIVSTKGRQASQQMIFKASGHGKVGDYPVICLINNGSASASEIVAGALQDHKRAMTLGTTTFGKGSVQSIIPLEGKGALRLTTARYYTPRGRAIQAKGIEPDLNVPFEASDAKKSEGETSASIREKNLSGAIPTEDKPAKPVGEAEGNKLLMTADKLAEDNQLRRALELLKAWEVFSSADVGRQQIPQAAAR
jgi:carboxyl-terminal processing protease